MHVILTSNKYRIEYKGTDTRFERTHYYPNGKAACTYIFYNCSMEKSIEQLIKETNYKIVYKK